MSTGSVVLLVVLATICAHLFSLSSAFQWVKDPGTEIKVTYPNQKTLMLRWDWRLSGSERLNQARITRYKTKDKDNTDKDIGFMYSDGSLKTETAYFRLNGKLGTAGGSNGYMELTINDINNQGYNGARDNSRVDVMVSNYTYECGVTIIGGNDYKSRSTTLIVYVKPTITRAPANIYVDSTKKDVVLKCKADGKPKPNIEWEIRRASGISTTKGEVLIISKLPGDDFQKTGDVGIYTCTATNNVGSVKASAVVQFIQCNAGCSADDKIAIEMTSLTYSSDYDNPHSAKYKELKDAIEKDCFNQYFKSRKSVYSCVVTSFRKGNHGVVANIKITYPTGTNEPRKPLQTAIETGTFAGQRVNTSFVRPTSPPVATSQPSTLPVTTRRPSTPPVTTRRPSTRPTIKTKFLLRLMLKLLESFKALIDVTTTLIKAHLMSSSDAQFKKREIVSMMNRVQHTSQNIEDSRDFQVIQAKRDVSEIRMRAQNLLQKLDDYIDDDPDFEYMK